MARRCHLPPFPPPPIEQHHRHHVRFRPLNPSPSDSLKSALESCTISTLHGALVFIFVVYSTFTLTGKISPPKKNLTKKYRKEIRRKKQSGRSGIHLHPATPTTHSLSLLFCRLTEKKSHSFWPCQRIPVQHCLGPAQSSPARPSPSPIAHPLSF